MTLDAIKSKIMSEVDKNREQIIAIGKEIFEYPEVGYYEEKTSKLVRDKFEELGIEYQYPLALTGVKGTLKGKSNEANVCVIGELDAVRCEGAPAHRCGHHTQIAAMLGVAIALKNSGVMEELDGTVSLMAVPAEEFIDFDLRKKLVEEGKISYIGGKQQLIVEGAFDDVDMAMMVHAQPNEPAGKMYVKGYNLGFTAETITFRGRAVHGSAPFDGVNALNAASLAILGMHANRETFKEEDRIRIHPIITKGGEVVNAVPDEVCLDTFIRGASKEAIEKGCDAFHRSCKGAAQMIGATVEFEGIPGYLPLKESEGLSDLFEEVCIELIGKENMVYGEPITGSTDMGDVSYIMPAIQPSVGGFVGSMHSKEFEAVDEDAAYLLPVKAMALTVAELLYDHAEKAKTIKNDFKPLMSKDEYLEYLKQI